jgi:hypothetical protein
LDLDLFSEAIRYIYKVAGAPECVTRKSAERNAEVPGEAARRVRQMERRKRVRLRLGRRRIGANAWSGFSQFVAEQLKGFYVPLAVGALEKMDFKAVPRGGIQLPVQVFFREFAAVQLLTLHSAPR